MGWVIAIIVIVFIIYLIRKGHNEDVQTYVTNFGGMQEKYKTLIEHFENEAGLKMTKLTKDHVTLSGRSIYTIDDLRGVTHIHLYSSLPIIGKISKGWKYPSGYLQEKMIQDIENYLQWELQRMASAGAKIVDEKINEL